MTVGRDVPCKVIPLKNGLLRLGKQGVAHCEPGIMLYYLWHEPTGLYWFECYTDMDYALKKASHTYGPRGMGEVSEWWRTETKQCQHSFRTEDKS
jgi:hypothetical protein